MESTFTLLRVRGIPIGVNWSWLFVFGIVVWSLAAALFPATYPGLDGSTYVAMAVVAAALFFASVLLHELGHAFRGMHEGIRLEGITLWLLGGVARLRGSPQSPGTEFRVAIAGPLVTLVITAVFWALTLVGHQLGWPAPVQGLADYLTRINLAVLGFNLVPALPLDGGRVLRSWLWRQQGSFTAATRSAAAAGQVFGGVLIAIGLVGLLGGTGLGGTGIGGLWLVFLGWFLIQAAQAEAQMARTRQALGQAEPAAEVAPGPGPGRWPDTRARRANPLVWLVVGLVILVAAALLYRPPYLVISPGAAFDVGGDVTIRGTRPTPLHGRYLAATVRLRQDTALGTLIAALRPDREVVAASRVLPRGVSAKRYFEQQHAVYQESQRLAAAAAAGALGLPVRIDGSGAEVLEVIRDSPAAAALRPGDVIVAIDGQRIATVQQLQSTVRARPAGSRFRLTVERGGRPVEVVLRSARLSNLAAGVGIGVAAQTRNLRVDLPFQISFRDRPAVGGPSAGLVYALTIADLLAPADYAAGRTVAATGTVDADGDVGPVGGVTEKAIAVREAGASQFLVPAQEVNDARQAEVSDLQVRGVDRVESALRLLTPAGS